MAEVKPLVSVLIPAYNAANTIEVAVRSILNQSLEDFELWVYNDGSTDDTAARLAAVADPRLQVLHGAANEGVAAARNALLRAARGKYIAWLDADDIALPCRLERQVRYLETHPEFDLLFGRIKVRNAAFEKVRFPTDEALLAAWLLFRNPYAQSTLMARNFFTREGVFYNMDYGFAEDYELYLRLRDRRFAMLPEYLSSYLQPPADRYPETTVQSALLPLLRSSFMRLGLKYDDVQVQAFLQFLRSTGRPDPFVAICLAGLRKADWPEPASAGKDTWLALQYFRALRWSVGRQRLHYAWQCFRLGPLMWFRVWKARVRYS